MELCLRKATMADAEMLFRWRNDPETRANSFHTAPIPYEEHIEWLEVALCNPAQEIYILCKRDTPVGQVRLFTEGDMAAISYSIDAGYRLKGYGKAILRLVENLCVKRGRPHALRGSVKKQNLASQAIFEGLGYVGQDDLELDCLQYTKRIL